MLAGLDQEMPEIDRATGPTVHTLAEREEPPVRDAMK
jgi:hypothetical protein